MRKWNKALLAAVLSGLALFTAGTILLMSAPSHFYQKSALFTGGLLSLSALILQIRYSCRHQDGRQARADWESD